MHSARTYTEGKPASPPSSARRGGLGTLVLLVVAVAVAALFLEQRGYDGPQEADFPLPPRYAGSYTDGWGAPRASGSHEGTDIFAPEGTPVRAAVGGTVVRARGSSESGWNTLGGYTVMVRAGYDIGPVERGDLIYYAHLESSPEPEPGDRVEPGQRLGAVGHTAGEREGALGDFPPHLHLGWYEGSLPFGKEKSRAQAESGAMNPYPLLRWIQKGGKERQARAPA